MPLQKYATVSKAVQVGYPSYYLTYVFFYVILERIRRINHFSIPQNTSILLSMSTPVWLITGASNGIGLVLSLHVLHAGHRVVCSVRSKTKSAEAVKQIEEAGGSVIELDMTESQASIASKVQALGRIDYLINVAGYSILAACEDIRYGMPSPRKIWIIDSL